MITVKQLMKDGVWLVPPAERPSGWEALAVRETHSAPTVVVTQSGVPDIVRCLCGKPNRHVGICIFRSSRAKVERVRREELFRSEIIPAIAESAKGFGAGGELELAARVLVAGMWTRKYKEVAQLTGAPAKMIRDVAKRCLRQKLWLTDGSVVLGTLAKDEGDLEFWLNAMAAYGEIVRCPDGKYRAIK